MLREIAAESGVSERTLWRRVAKLRAGEKLPEDSAKWDSFILAYDDKELDGSYHCAMAAGCESPIPVKDVKELLRKRGK